jgi:hypothetical protein
MADASSATTAPGLPAGWFMEMRVQMNSKTVVTD